MKTNLLFLVSFLLISGWKGSSLQATTEVSLGERADLAISGYLKNETYTRVGHGPDRIMSSRNVFNLDLDLNFTDIPLIRRAFVQLRPVYDAVFDIENEGTGGGTSRLRHHFQDNFGVGDDWEPLLREAWVNLSLGKLDGRLGRQIISWGRSDGIYLLDLINPFNYRNWSVFDEEDLKIPLWMVNLNYEVKPMYTVQFLFIPRYVPAHVAFDGHDWAPNVKVFADNFNKWLSAPLFAPPLFGAGATIKVDEPSTNFSNAEYGVRFSGKWKGLDYTLNYFYTWDDILNQYPTGAWWDYGAVAGLGYPLLVNTEYTIKADRLSVIGGSYNYFWENFLGLKEMVTRGEFAYFRNDVFVDYTFNNREKDVIGIMLGFDKYYFIDYWFSLQIGQTYILKSDHAKQAYYDLGAYALGTGMRDEVETNLTFFLMKDYLPGDTLHTQLFLLYDDDGAFWFRTKVKYDVTDQFHVTLGTNFYWGNKDDPFVGESHHRDNIFVELLWGF